MSNDVPGSKDFVGAAASFFLVGERAVRSCSHVELVDLRSKLDGWRAGCFYSCIPGVLVADDCRRIFNLCVVRHPSCFVADDCRRIFVLCVVRHPSMLNFLALVYSVLLVFLTRLLDIM